MVEPYTEFSLEAPGGEVKVRAQCSNGRVDKVYLTPQPSYLAVADAMVRFQSMVTQQRPTQIENTQ